MMIKASQLPDFFICPFVTLVLQRNFKYIDSALAAKVVPWSNVFGFESDTMIGKHTSVLSRAKLKCPNIFSLGCVCHLANICLLAEECRDISQSPACDAGKNGSSSVRLDNCLI